jgi:hypothetical protein
MTRFLPRYVAVAAFTAVIGATGCAALAQSAPALTTKEGEFVVHDFKFRSGETLPALKLHYTTLGTPKRDADGHVNNAVIVMHGTGGDGHQFLRPQFANILFAPGGLLDRPRCTSSCPTASATANPQNPATACMRVFRNTTMTTWSPRSTLWSPRAWA